MRVRSVTPILNVSDFAASVEWFGKLGWTPGFTWTAPGETRPGFGAVVSGEFEIFLCVDGQGGRGADGVWLAIWVSDATAVDAMHATCLRSSVQVIREPHNEPWDVREMHVRHPDGHVLRISAPARSHGH